MNTAIQQAAATVNKLRLYQASTTPTISAHTPEIGVLVEVIIAGNVITARVT